MVIRDRNIPSEKTGGATVTISCPEGIAKLQVTIISEKLSPMLPDVGLCESFDLVDPKTEDGKDLTNDLRGIGLPCGDDVKGKTEVLFDITMFMDLLVFEDDYNFELEVVDTKGKSSSLTLKFSDK
ncbi:MAG: hypothetical protein K2M55_05730, partial [Muribaculaceae bacterium]|nr:hypothetical protein [Muribaculaceae bacterium]